MNPLSLVTQVPSIRLSPADFVPHRAAMLQFARGRIRDAFLAEDAVQEALMAALKGIGTFQGQSALRTWLFGILNHKIQDAFRRESRYVGIGDTEQASAEECLERIAGDDPQRADDPADCVARRHLQEALAGEIEALPPGQRDVFRLQVLEGLDTEDVCARLGISESNCWVRLHRARRRLAERLGHHLH